ncbi:unnamed protein product [Amoebophrya sp. A120]|nr:unnamed protein product [Amoebophrya sp. A120]|eukprot:GSA120T00005443001.1
MSSDEDTNTACSSQYSDLSSSNEGTQGRSSSSRSSSDLNHLETLTRQIVQTAEYNSTRVCVSVETSFWGLPRRDERNAMYLRIDGVRSYWDDKRSQFCFWFYSCGSNSFEDVVGYTVDVLDSAFVQAGVSASIRRIGAYRWDWWSTRHPVYYDNEDFCQTPGDVEEELEREKAFRDSWDEVIEAAHDGDVITLEVELVPS